MFAVVLTYFVLKIKIGKSCSQKYKY